MKILIADDDNLSRHLLERQLRAWAYEVVSARDGLEAWDILCAPDPPRLVVLDWVMPGLDGPELCQRIRAQALEPYVYALLLTAKHRREDIVAGLDAGADDYVTKPFNVPELKVRLRAAARIVSLQTELVAARETLRFQASHDPLTGLCNRAATNQALERAVLRAALDGEPVAVAMIDLDHFKSVNDTHGHPAGDAVLREAARRISGAVRPGDVVGRYGGEEFLVVLPGCGPADAAAVGERIREQVAAWPVSLGRASIEVTASVGVGVAPAAAEANPQGLVAAADAALYGAKRGGRNRVERCVLLAPEAPELPRRLSSRAPPLPEVALAACAAR